MKYAKGIYISAVVIDETSRVPAYRQLYASLRDLILSGVLAAGVRLPSTRLLASDIQVSRNTVTNAFELLESEGFIRMEIGRGTFVLELPFLTGRRGQTDSPNKPLQRSSSKPAAMALSAKFGSASPSALRPLSFGLPAIHAFPIDTWKRVAERTIREQPVSSLDYGDTLGLPKLRVQIAEYLATSRGVDCSPDQVIVVSSGQQGIDLVARTLLSANDQVWLEDPGYLGARSAFESNQAEIVPVPVDDQGLNVAKGIAVAPTARLAYVTPSHQFPLGSVLTVERRLALLEWARENNSWIIEDDYDSEFRFRGKPISALQGMDEHGRVVYIGTFTKVLFPSLRIAYVVAPPELVEPLIAQRVSVDGHAPVMGQATVANFLREGHFAVHLRKMRKLYVEQQEFLVESANRMTSDLGLERSPAGMHLIAKLPPQIDDQNLSRTAFERNVDVPALSKYYLSSAKVGGLMLGYTGSTPEQIWAALQSLDSLLQDQ